MSYLGDTWFDGGWRGVRIWFDVALLALQTHLEQPFTPRRLAF